MRKSTRASASHVRAKACDILRTIKPKAVILAQHDFYVGSIFDNNGDIPSDSEQVVLWKRAFRSFIEQYEG